MIRFRPLASLLLALIVALTSVTSAVARVQPPGNQIVICSGVGVITITVDDQGNPTGSPLGPVHPCPDCVAAFGPALLMSPVLPVRPLSRSVALDVPEVLQGTGGAAPQPMARGPPGLV